MDLLKYSFILAIRAIPHLIVSKFVLEIRYSIYGSLAMLLALGAVVLSPMFVVFLPLSAAFMTTCFTLTNLHSMLGFIGSTGKLNQEYLRAEMLKMSMVRGAFYMLASLPVVLILLAIYGLEHFTLFFTSPWQFLRADLTMMLDHRIPSILLASFIYVPFFFVVEVLFAVPMAGAAYSIGETDRSFNGFWGIGYNFWPILVSRLTYIALVTCFTALVIEVLIPEVSLASLWHFAQSYLTGTAPDSLAYPLAEPALDSPASQLAALVLIVFSGYLSQPLWLATSVLSFRRKLEEETEAKALARPSPEDVAAARAAEAARARVSTVSLRKARMPARWQA